jgi:hypothetical protein
MSFQWFNMGFFSFKSTLQLIAGLLFFAIGIFILVSNFNNNKILIGSTKYLFGGILALYGLVRIGRMYFIWKSLNSKNHEDHSE